MNAVTRIGRVVSIATIAGTLALVSAGAVFAQTPGSADPTAPANHAPRHRGLIGRALELDSLSPAQRTAIEQLAQESRTARAPVRQADAQLLTSLATQVESGTIDRQALGPALQARQSAALSAQVAGRDAIQKLHDLLTAAQRTALIDSIESSADRPERDGGARAGMFDRIAVRLGLTSAQRQQIAANLSAERQGRAKATAPDRVSLRQARETWLESFRSDSFHVGSAAPDRARAAMDRRVERTQDLLQAAVPVLTPAQRAQVASRLRARAARESQG